LVPREQNKLCLRRFFGELCRETALTNSKIAPPFVLQVNSQRYPEHHLLLRLTALSAETGRSKREVNTEWADAERIPVRSQNCQH
jgi:hypothetical protein